MTWFIELETYHPAGDYAEEIGRAYFINQYAPSWLAPQPRPGQQSHQDGTCWYCLAGPFEDLVAVRRWLEEHLAI